MLADPRSHLSPAAEQAEYEKHQNDASDQGYRRFAARLFSPICQALPKPGAVLDFGSGKSSALAALFSEAGYRVHCFDPFFCNDRSVLETTYKIVVLSEVLEHLQSPREELTRLWSLVDQGGVLGIQTQRLISRERFDRWRYKDDPTHVAFYSERTLHVVAAILGATAEILPRDVALFHKQ